MQSARVDHGASLANRALLVTAYWWTNLTMRQIAPLFGVSKPARMKTWAILRDCRPRNPDELSGEGSPYTQWL